VKGIEALELGALIEHARVLRACMTARVGSERVELFAKVSHRRRATRDATCDVSLHDVRESGLACRVFGREGEPAGFASASGVSTSEAEWVADRARTFEGRASGSTPEPSDLAGERWDLDPADSLPTGDSLIALVRERKAVEWIELGTTVEILIGSQGWMACRRRNRAWLLGSNGRGEIRARRGFEDLAEQDEDAISSIPPGGIVPTSLVLAPSASGALVSALVSAFHRSNEQCGAGLDVDDVPAHEEGLAGGAFDDAGFPTSPRPITADGYWVPFEPGPGNVWRGSFRAPPTPGTSNLVVSPGKPASHGDCLRISKCRVVPLGRDVWVLDLETGQGGPRFAARVDPRAVSLAPIATLGPAVPTATGPIGPHLVVDGGLLGLREIV